MDFVTKSFRKDETLTSWTLLQHICPQFWAWLLNTIAITPKSEDKYVVKVFNSSEFHLSEMTLLQNPYFNKLAPLTVFSTVKQLARLIETWEYYSCWSWILWHFLNSNSVHFIIKILFIQKFTDMITQVLKFFFSASDIMEAVGGCFRFYGMKVSWFKSLMLAAK